MATVELPVGIALDVLRVLLALRDLPAIVRRVEDELGAGEGLVDNALDWLRAALEGR